VSTNPGSGLERTESGLFVPSGQGTAPADGAVEMAQRLAAYIEEQVGQVVFWAERWPKGNERPLASGDITETCLVRARAWLWPRDVTETITRRALERLGFGPKRPAGPETRQQRRARERAERERASGPMGGPGPSPVVALANRQPLPPAPDGPVVDEQPPDSIEAARGYAPEHTPRLEEPLL
jgi:hypothetical protein